MEECNYPYKSDLMKSLELAIHIHTTLSLSLRFSGPSVLDGSDWTINVGCLINGLHDPDDQFGSV